MFTNEDARLLGALISHQHHDDLLDAINSNNTTVVTNLVNGAIAFNKSALHFHRTIGNTFSQERNKDDITKLEEFKSQKLSNPKIEELLSLN